MRRWLRILMWSFNAGVAYHLAYHYEGLTAAVWHGLTYCALAIASIEASRLVLTTTAITVVDYIRGKE